MYHATGGPCPLPPEHQHWRLFLQHHDSLCETRRSEILGLSYESMWLVVVCLADAVSTVVCVGLGVATEYNPIMAWLLNRGDMVFLAGKLASFTPFVFVCEMYRRREPVRGRLLLRWALGLYLLFYVTMVALVNTGVL